jgi:hypothetical protein
VQVGSTKQVVGLLVAVVCLTGCGTTGLTPKISIKRTSVAATPIVQPVVAPEAAAVEKARALLAAVDAATKQVHNWTASASNEMVGPDGTKSWNLSKVNFKHPATMCATVLKASDDKTVNTKVVYDGGDQIQLKTYFFGFLAIKISLPHDDARLLDPYNRSLKQTQTKQLFDTILHPKATAAWIGEGTAGGEAVDFLDIKSPASWKGISHEVVGISRRLNLPILRDSFNYKNQRIVHLELKGMKLNFRPKSGDFSLD